MSQEPLPSATVIVLRAAEAGIEVLLLQRAARPDAKKDPPWVFPGGKVDDADRSGANDSETTVARRAAVRELHEEAGLAIDPESLLPFSRWVTPEISPKRFDTWFFVAELEVAQPVQVDGVEIGRHRWMSAPEALAAKQRGEIDLAPPTFVTLVTVAAYANCREARSGLASGPFITFRPQVCRTERGPCMLYPGDAGYAARDPEREGSRHRLWALESGWRYERDDEAMASL